MPRCCSFVVTVSMALLVTACGSSSAPSVSPSPAAASQAVVSVSVAPSPATGAVCNPKCTGSTGATFDYSVTVTAIVTESAGLAGNIDGIDWSATRNGALFAPLTISPNLIIQAAGSNHVGARGTLSVPITVLYNSPGGKDINVSLAVHFTDDKGNVSTPRASVAVL